MPLADDIISRWNSLESSRNSASASWQDLRDLIAPEVRLELYDETSGTARRATTIFDTTAIDCRRVLANGLMSHLTPIGSEWFAFTPDEDAEGEYGRYLYQSGQKLARLLAPSRSNFYDALSKSYTDDATWGTSVIMPRVTEDGNLHFLTLRINTYCLGDDADGNATTLYRKYKLSAANYLSRFGDDTPANIAKLAANPKKMDECFTVIHAIEPNAKRDRTKDDKENKPFRSVYVDMESKSVIRHEGFDMQPHAVGQWDDSAEGAYGIAPAEPVLPTIKQLQQLELDADLLSEKMADPPWLIPSTFRGKFNPAAGAQNIYESNIGGDQGKPEAVVSQGRYDIANDRIERKREEIKRVFHYDLFRLLSTNMETQKTAFEVQELMAEKSDAFHPFYARKTQQLSHLLKRAFQLCIIHGLLPPPPESVTQRAVDGTPELPDIAVSYNTRLSRAVEINQANALFRVIQNLLPLAGQEGLASPVFDFIKQDQVGLILAHAEGVPHSVLADPEEIAAKIQARQEAAQAMQMQAAVATGADAVNKLGGVDKTAEALQQISE